MRKTGYIFTIAILFFVNAVCAQQRGTIIQINIAPDHENWIYSVGEQVRFNVSVLKYGNPMKDIELKYQLMQEKMEPVKEEVMKLNKSELMIKGGTLESPGFLRCKVSVTIDGHEYSNIATAAFDPDKIEPTVEQPDDFDTFWKAAIEENKKIPLDPKMTLLTDKCTDKVNVYHISFQNNKEASRIYGILSVPKESGKFPAILEVPGYGVRPYHGRPDISEEGIVYLQIGINGIPVTMPDEVYQDLRYGALDEYCLFNLTDPNAYYYKRVYLGCLKAVDFISGLTQYDGKNLAVVGESQGGGLSIVVAAMDKRVKYLALYYPALCDMTGYLHGRAGGWPHIFANNPDDPCKEEKLKTIGYYDVVNFAKRLTQKGWYSFGFNDEVCPPTSMYAAYNSVSSEKEIHLFQNTGHWVYPEGREMRTQWLLTQLKSK